MRYPKEPKNSKGRAIQNLLNIDSDDAVNAYLRVKNLNDQDFINSHYVLFCTKNGVIKKTLLEHIPVLAKMVSMPLQSAKMTA